jgi:hypothetical protein
MVIVLQTNRPSIAPADKRSDDEQNGVRAKERNRVPSRLREDWLEFLLTLVLFTGLLLGLVREVIASSRS